MWTHRHSVSTALLLAGGLLAAGTPRGANGPPTAPRISPEEAGAAVEAVSKRVEEIRGLAFKRPVPVHLVSHADTREYATKRLKRFTTEEQLAAEERAYVTLGLLPPGVPILNEYTRLIEEAAAGFYDPDSGSFFLLDDLPSGTASVLSAHELTHALEDQHYDLDSRFEAASHDADLGFAVMAVHEGSASLLMAVYAARGLAEGWIKKEELEALAASEAGHGAAVARTDPLLRRPLLGAYILGARFLARGSPRALTSESFPKEDADRSYRAGPVSSEQILHPEKFWDAVLRDDPKPVPIEDMGPLLGDGWERAGDGSLGELMLGSLVGAPTPRGWADGAYGGAHAWTNEAASGWGGDRWELWTRQASAVVLLETVWDSVEDARQFARALPERPTFVSKREGARVGIVAGDPGRGNARRLLKGLLREPGSSAVANPL